MHHSARKLNLQRAASISYDSLQMSKGAVVAKTLQRINAVESVVQATTHLYRILVLSQLSGLGALGSVTVERTFEARRRVGETMRGTT